MRFILSAFLFFFLINFSKTGLGQTCNEYLIHAKDLIAKGKETEAYPILMNAVKADNKNMEALTLASFYSDKEGNRQSNSNIRNAMYKVSKIYAEQAIKLYPNEAEANYVLGVALGRIALISGSKDKVKLSKEIKDLGEKCIKLNPNHAGGYHLLGLWHYEVCNLNVFEKAAVNMLFGGLPTAKMETACAMLSKAIQLRSDYMLYHLDYAKALHNNEQNELAIKQLNFVINMKPTTQDDPKLIEEAKMLLRKWK